MILRERPFITLIKVDDLNQILINGKYQLPKTYLMIDFEHDQIYDWQEHQQHAQKLYTLFFDSGLKWYS